LNDPFTIALLSATEPATTISFGEIVAQLLLVAILITFNAFFVLIEFAAIVSRRSRVDQLAAEGGYGARILQRWLSDAKGRERLVAVSQLGITVVSLALGNQGELTFELIIGSLFKGIVVPPELAGIMQALPLVVSLLIISSFHVIFGEQVPKVAALRDPERIATFLAPPMRLFEWLTTPLVWLLDRIASWVLKRFGLTAEGAHSTVYTADEIKQIVRESGESGVLGESESELITAVFDIRDLVTRQVMIPRTEIKMIDVEGRFGDLIKLATESPHTRFPVYEIDADHIIGVLYVKDMIRALSNPREQRTIRSLTREVLLVPENLPVEELLARFRTRRQQIAIVLDEFGGTAGLVTLEDIIEELVGELADQFETARPDAQHLKDGTTSISGLMNITDFNESFNFHLVDGNYDTLGGYIMGKLERIPIVGDKIALDGGATLRVEAMDGMRVDRLSLVPATRPKAEQKEKAEQKAAL